MAFELMINSFPRMVVFLLAILGACFGSFAGVIIYRWPKGLSIISPRSFCGLCKTKLKVWHNIPLVSWLLLRGKCAVCRKPFGYRPILLEILFVLSLLAIYGQVGLSLSLIDKFGFVFLLICLAYIDLDTYYLPHSLLVALVLWGLLFSGIYTAHPHLFMPVSEPASLLSSMVLRRLPAFSLSDRLLGAAIGLTAFSLINVVASYILRRRKRILSHQWAMGWGDPLLLMAIGLFVGLSHLLVVIFVASALGSIAGILSKFVSRIRKEMPEDIADGALPYGPFLAIAAIYVYLF